jgi:hypothetical protein
MTGLRVLRAGLEAEFFILARMKIVIMDWKYKKMPWILQINYFGVHFIFLFSYEFYSLTNYGY